MDWGRCPVCRTWASIYAGPGFQHPATTDNTRMMGHVTGDRQHARQRPERLPPLPEGKYLCRGTDQRPVEIYFGAQPGT